MNDLTAPAPDGTTTSPDARRAAVDQALAAVLEWLRVNHQIRRTATWPPWTSLSRPPRSGSRAPGGSVAEAEPSSPDGLDLRSLGDMTLRQAQKMRRLLDDIERVDVEATEELTASLAEAARQVTSATVARTAQARSLRAIEERR
ncbi:MAG: hypothetical protein ACRDUV_05595 [Pseudonocardiaceae bacterium]